MIAPVLCAVLAGSLDPRPPCGFESAPVPAPRSSLAQERQNDEARVGLGLVLASRGRLGEALAVWDELIADEAAPQDLRARARIERARIASYVEARAGFFERVATSGKKLVFDWQGGRLVTAVESLTGDTLILKENRRDIAKLDLDALDPLEVAGWMGDPKYGPPVGWVRHWPGVAAGDARSLRRLKAIADSEARQVVADVEDVWPAFLALGRAAAELYDLARANPTNSETGLRWLERLEALLAMHGELALVRDRKQALRSLASPVIEQVSNGIGIDALFAAHGTELEPGRYRLLYAFDDAHELEDFEVATEIPTDYARFAQLQTSNTPLTISEGALHARGRHLLTHIIPFEAPLAVRWTIEFRTGVMRDPEVVNLAVFACHDGSEQYVMNVNLGDLEVRDGARFDVDRIPQKERFLPYDKKHEVALIHTGETVLVEFGGKQVAEIEGQAPMSGALTLYLHSDMPLWLHELEIEGGITFANQRPLRRAWAEARRAALR